MTVGSAFSRQLFHSGHTYTGVEITTRQLAKCEWNLELASNFLNLLASLASVFFSPLSESHFTANWVLFLADSEIQTRIWHGDLLIIMTHTQTRWFTYYYDTHTVYFSSRPSTEKVHTVQMLSKDMILARFYLIWQVKIWVTRQSGEYLENLNSTPAYTSEGKEKK
jgi:hypothetical protein